MSPINSVDTPCLVVDEARLDRNIARMNGRIGELGIVLRPHVKTAKSTAIAERIFGGARGPITVSTLVEATYFAEAGYADILYAVGMVPGRVPRAARLLRAGVDLKVIVDDAAVAREVARCCEAEAVSMGMFIEVDCDGQRAGVRPDDNRLLEVAEAISSSETLDLAGVMTHGGLSYSCDTLECIREVARQEHSAIVAAADTVRRAGFDCPNVSLGSSPTVWLVDELAGVTEVRAGVYVFEDLVQAGLGVCDVGDIALSVLTTVIGHRRDLGRLIVDAGGLALSKDRGTAAQKLDCGYGLVAEAGSRRLLAGYRVAEVNQEHGIVECRQGTIDFDAHPIGSKLEVLPNHACMTAAAHDRYLVARGADIVAEWSRCNGW